jgi:2-keto-4-pentenoate hydratase/2-oxohepta-3-ene-1,7-dioic acid hydratase in catechol pathway
MKLVSTTEGVGRVEGDEVVLLDLPDPDLGAVLARGALEECATAPTRARRPYAEVTLRAPIPQPPKVICIGINYQSHVEELRTVLGKFPAPERPVFFFIPSSAVCGPTDPIQRPIVDPDKVDHECELAVVIGRGGRDIDPENSWSHVAGITMANDVSARELQSLAMTGPQFELSHAKGFDTFKPMGPLLVTTDELDLPLDLAITCSVNGEVHQQARTTDLIFDVPACIAEVSRYVSLVPGDVILTGSPAGVGFFAGRFLVDGDIVKVTGEGIGTLLNVVQPSPALAAAASKP